MVGWGGYYERERARKEAERVDNETRLALTITLSVLLFLVVCKIAGWI